MDTKRMPIVTLSSSSALTVKTRKTWRRGNSVQPWCDAINQSQKIITFFKLSEALQQPPAVLNIPNKLHD
jgi:hypothetical protein